MHVCEGTHSCIHICAEPVFLLSFPNLRFYKGMQHRVFKSNTKPWVPLIVQKKNYQKNIYTYVLDKTSQPKIPPFSSIIKNPFSSSIFFYHQKCIFMYVKIWNPNIAFLQVKYNLGQHSILILNKPLNWNANFVTNSFRDLPTDSSLCLSVSCLLFWQYAL